MGSKSSYPKTEWQRQIYENPEYLGKVIAISGNKVVYFADSYEEVIDKMNKKKVTYSLFNVPKNLWDLRVLTFKIKSLKKHPWVPNYPVKFYFDDSNIVEEEMIVDSGADISLVNNSFGRIAGFIKTPHEVVQYAEGIGGSAPCLLRNIDIEVDGFKFNTIVAWLQDEDIPDMILGREIVFDLFDIEFKQADEEIIFRKR